MLKILQARLQQYVKCEVPDVQACFGKGRETRDQIANIHWIIKKAREFQKNIYFCFIDYVKAFDKQKTAYEMVVCDWSSDVCSSDLRNRCFSGTLLRF